MSLVGTETEKVGDFWSTLRGDDAASAPVSLSQEGRVSKLCGKCLLVVGAKADASGLKGLNSYTSPWTVVALLATGGDATLFTGLSSEAQSLLPARSTGLEGTLSRSTLSGKMPSCFRALIGHMPVSFAFS